MMEYTYQDWPYSALTFQATAYVDALIKVDETPAINIVQRAIYFPYPVHNRETAIGHSGSWEGLYFVGSIVTATYQSYPNFNDVEYANYNYWSHPMI